MLFHCKIEYPPSINHYYQTNKYNNKKFINAKAKDYMQRNSRHIEQIMTNNNLVTIDYAVDLYLYVYLPDNRRRDKDNIQKCILDTMQMAGLVIDDFLIKNICVYDMGVKKGGECVLLFLLPHSPQALLDEYLFYYFN